MLFTNLFLESQLHEIGYTQHCDVPLRRVQTLDLDFEASLTKEVGYFSAMTSDHIPRIIVFIT